MALYMETHSRGPIAHVFSMDDNIGELHVFRRMLRMNEHIFHNKERRPYLRLTGASRISATALLVAYSPELVFSTADARITWETEHGLTSFTPTR